MHFTLTSEQNDFADSLRALLTAANPTELTRDWRSGRTDSGSALWQQLAETGVFGLTVDAEFDGLGATPVDLVVAFTELGRAAAPGPLIASAAAIPALLQALPDSGPAKELLSQTAEGTVATVSFDATTPAMDADLAEIRLLVTTDESGVPTLSTATAGERAHSIDPGRRIFALVPDRVLAQGDGVAEAVAAGFDAGVLAAAAYLLGAGRALLETSVTYAQQRSQYGDPIGRYQAVQHQLADVRIALDMAEPLLLRAALTQTGPEGWAESAESTRSRDVSAAHLACAAAAYRAARTAVQIHGALGYTAEFNLAPWLTTIFGLRQVWGTELEHRTRIAAALRTEGATA
ncbi:acyl-CoA dehydrogenase family protein [Nocardia stercoris]|uniref:Acyl-CoA dehydrogenase n=1 Tax=Nocardia stercoris TaxID=2483361 RepID=A0A3M2KV25_9NOCA|nr:acyl-CoA dehydrogenase family protein [Nocardia stercoris]RMI28280.1 acyl-CoA dehydrogenase [Nocardia stercoris]